MKRKTEANQQGVSDGAAKSQHGETAMSICETCSAKTGHGFQNEGRCQNGFIQGGYPSGIPNCMKEDGPGTAYFLFPPEQWDALRLVDTEIVKMTQ